MSLIDKINKIKKEMVDWRRKLHSFPELGFEEYKTSNFIQTKLNQFGIKFYKNIAKTGIVAEIEGVEKGNKSIGLRADMDALPMTEENNFDHKSKVIGKMHACGHDGHIAMLLGAAKYLSSTRNFSGKVYLIFQPAEEGLGGGKVMIEEGLFEKFPVDSVWGMHNWPGIEPGQAAVNNNIVMASSDSFFIEIVGKGGHAAAPQHSLDPIPIASLIVSGLQSIVSRNIDPLESSVLSVTKINAGSAFNVIPNKVEICGTCRTFKEKNRIKLEKMMKSIVINIAQAYGAKAKMKYKKIFPVTVNTEMESEKAIKSLQDVLGVSSVMKNIPPSMGSEDFAFMLEQRPGAYILLGSGGASKGKMLHTTKYDFNDEILTLGASYWSKLVENELQRNQE